MALHCNTLTPYIPLACLDEALSKSTTPAGCPNLRCKPKANCDQTVLKQPRFVLPASCHMRVLWHVLPEAQSWQAVEAPTYRCSCPLHAHLAFSLTEHRSVQLVLACQLKHASVGLLAVDAQEGLQPTHRGQLGLRALQQGLWRSGALTFCLLAARHVVPVDQETEEWSPVVAKATSGHRLQGLAGYCVAIGGTTKEHLPHP